MMYGQKKSSASVIILGSATEMTLGVYGLGIEIGFDGTVRKNYQ